MGGLLSHRTKDVCAQRAIVRTVCGPQGRDVVSLRQHRMPGVIRAPARKLPEFGKRDQEPATGGLIVGGLNQ